MSHIVGFLDELRLRQVSLWLEHDRLRYRAPKDGLTEELFTQLKARKPEIIAFLKQANTQHQAQIPPITAIDRDHPLPLSFAQQRLWFLQQLDPHSTSNNMPVVVRFEGSLNIEILEKSVQEVMRRHEVLRSRFPTVKGQPTVVVEQDTITLPIVDLRRMPASEREAEAHRQATEEARQPFNLAKGPILRIKLFWLTDAEYLFIWNMHCIVCDGASSDVFYQDLTAIYQAFVAGQPSPLPTLPVQYADFSHWQREWLQGDLLESQLSYWQRILDDSLPLIQLPFDRLRPVKVQSYKGDRAAKMLPLSLNQELIKLGQQVGATQFMILLAAFEVLLYRYSSQEDILINVASAGRGNVETERLLGFFSNTLLLKADLSGNPTFREFLLRVKQSSLEAFAHQDLPFEKVVEELRPEQRQTRSSLFQVKFALNPPWSKGRGMAAIHLPELTITSLFGYIYHGETKYDLTLVMREQDEGLGMVFDFNADVFETDTIARMVEHFHILLDGIVQNPDQPITMLPLLTAVERQQLLVAVAQDQPTAPETQVVGVQQFFEDQVSRNPNEIALTTPTQQLTYQDLNRQANQFAHYLQSIGVTAATPVAICIEKSAALIVAQLAVLKAGGIYIPISTDASKHQIEKILADAQAAIVLTQQSISEQLEGHANTIICIDTHQHIIRNQTSQNLCTSAADDVACILFKDDSVGVEITHRGIVHLGRYTEPLRLSSSDILLQWASPTSDLALFEVFAALLNGSQLVIPQPQMLIEDLGALIRRHQITALYLPTRLFNFVVENHLEDLQSIQHCLIGGALVSAYHIQKVLQALPKCCLFNTYRTVENTGLVCLQNLQEPLLLSAGAQVGHPLDNTTIYILDRHLQPLPIGVEGDLYLGGDKLAKGYLNQFQKIQENFIPNPFIQSDPSHQQSKYLFRTSERAKRLPDGSIVINNINVLGQAARLSDVEIALTRHPLVKECTLVAFEESEDRQYLVAYVVAKQQNLTSRELYEFLKKQLSSHLIPANFVVLESLPLTSLGEVDLDILPLPNAPKYAWENAKVAAQSQMEHQLIKIWKQILKIQSIGTTDNFFELGGNSLLAMNLAIKIEQQLGKTLPLSLFFQAPTIRELVLALQQEQPQSDWFSLVPIQPKGTRSPLFCVHFILRPLASYMGPEQPVYALRYGIAAQTTQSVQNLPDQVEKLAAHYIQEMQRLQPVGPYHLMGSSFGGTIAFEMAQQLLKQGEEVALLAIFDTSMWTRPPVLPAYRGLSKYFKMGIPGLLHIIKYRLGEIRFQLTNKGEYAPHYYGGYEGNLCKPYHPQFFAGQILFFQALDEAAKYGDPSWLPAQWQQVVATLETFNLPGDHNTILKDPHVHAIVQVLQKFFEDTQSQPSTYMEGMPEKMLIQ